MAGHSRWAQIKRQKGAADAKRGTLFTKLAAHIAAAVREGGKDPGMNLRLRFALDKAKAANMPSSTIERAILRGAGELGDKPIEQVVYEAFGPGGAALMIEALTDNKNRTAAAMRAALGDHGGSLAASGSVRWMFELRGVLELSPAPSDEATLQLADAGADDVLSADDGATVVCAPARLVAVRDAAEAAGLAVSNAEIAFLPKPASRAALSPADETKLFQLIETLEAIDDITNVFPNT